MTETTRCNVCNKVEDSVKIREEKDKLNKWYKQIGAAMDSPTTKPEGWNKLYGYDLCPECFDAYWDRALPLQEQMQSEMDFIYEEYKDAAKALIRRQIEDAGGEPKLKAIH